MNGTWRLVALTGLAAGLACADDGDLRLEPVASVIDSEGGMVISDDRALLLDVPSGALGQAERITVEERSAAGFPRVVSKIYELGPDGLTFDRPVTLTIRNLASDEELTIAQIVGNSAIPVENARWEPSRGLVTAELEHFSSYAAMVVYTPCGARTCGDTCAVCDPLLPSCIEPPPLAKACNQSGLCVEASLPMCPGAADAGAILDAATPDSGPIDAGQVADTGASLDAGPPICGDVLHQRPQPLVDVLLIIDATGSMGEEQATLAASVPLVLQTLDQNNTDFHIGVTNTRSYNQPGLPGAGTLVSVPPILTSSTPNLSAAFAASVQMQLTGGAARDESGLLVATQTLTATGAAGFHRPGSALTVIVLSDEPEQSPDPVATYVNALLAAKGPYGERRLQINNITGPESIICRGTGGSASAAPRYHMARRLTNGAFSEICSPPYSQALTDLGPSDYGYEFVFGLTQTLTSTQSLQVLVDGVVTTQWSFDASLNAVVFPEIAVPAPSAQVELRYLCP